MISEATLKKAVSGHKVLIDSNIIIYLTDSIQPYKFLAQFLFEMIEYGDAEAIISIREHYQFVNRFFIHRGKSYKNMKKALDIPADRLYSIINNHHEKQEIKWNRRVARDFADSLLRMTN